MKRFCFLLFLIALFVAVWPPVGRADDPGAQRKGGLGAKAAPPDPVAGVEQPLRFARPGEIVTFTLTLTNTGLWPQTYKIGATTNYGDNEFFLIGLSRHPKYERFPATSVEIGAQSHQTLALGVNIPSYATPGMVHRIETYISGAQDAAPVELQLTTVVSGPTAIERVGHAGLAVKDVFVQGGYAYLAAGREGLRILDISDPTRPVEIGFYAPAADPFWSAEQVVVQEGYAYVAAGPAGLRIIDLAEPTRPVEVGHYSGVGYPGRVKLVGEYIYLVWQVCHYPPCSSRLHIIDVSNPARPVQTGLYEGVYDLDIAGGYAYLAAGTEGVRVLDISDPAAPVEVGPQPVESYNIQVIRAAGGYVYAINYNSLVVLDLTEPARPVEAGQIDFFIYPVTITPMGRYLYLTDSSGNLVAVDIANPAQPVALEGEPEVARQVQAAALAGDSLAYLAAGPAGLRLVDIADPLAPNVVAVFGGPGYAQGLAVAGGYAYVADRYNGLRILDVAEPAHPVEVGFYSQRGGSQQVVLKDKYAYVTFGNCPKIYSERTIPDRCQTDMYVLDVSNPAALVETAVYKSWQEIKFWDDQAYVLDEAGNLHLYDLADPSQPVEVKRLAGQIGDYILANGYVYLLTPHNWTYTGDSSNPYTSESYLKILEAGSLAELSVTRIPEKNPALNVTVAGRYAYIYWEARLLDAYVHGWLTMDVSDPAAPGLLEAGYQPFNTQAAVVSDRYAYLADGKAGLRVLDLADPANPVEVDAFGAEGLAMDVAITGGHIYLANGPAGLYILRYAGAE